MRYLGVLVGILLILSFAAVGIALQPRQDTSFSAQSSVENYEDMKPFEDSDIWTEDHGVTFKNSTSRNTSSDLDHNGNIDVAWEDDRTGERNIFYVKLRNRDGEKLINDFRVTDNERPSLNPKIATRENNIFVIWQENEGDGWNLYFSKLEYSDEEISFVEEKERIELLELGEGEPKEYSFIRGENARFHLVYERSKEGERNIYYARINTEGGTTMGPLPITDSPDFSQNPKIRRARNDHLHILWLEPIERNNGLFYKQIDLDGNTEEERKRLTVVKRLTRYDLTRDSEGQLHLVFDDDRYHDYKRDVIYQRLDGSGKIITDDTLITQRDDDNNSFSPSITLGKEDEMFVSWADSRDYWDPTEERRNITEIPHDIYLTAIDQDGEKVRPSQRLTERSSFSANPILKTDEDNEQHLLWEDDRKDVMDIYYKRTNKPDLAVEDIVVDPSEPLYNSNVSVEILLKNEGGSRIDTIGSLYLENEDQLLEQVNISIGPGKEESFIVEFTTLEKGNQTLIFAANEERDEIEKNYTNNRDQTTFFTRYYDLSMTPITETAAVDPGESAEFEYNVTNEGNRPQDIEVDVNITGPEEGVEVVNPSTNERLNDTETHTHNFTATTQDDQLAGEYTIGVTVRSLETKDLEVRENFTLTVNPIYDISLHIYETNISDPAEMNYTVDMTVTNEGNTDQEILVYVGQGNEYAVIDGGMMILEPGESRNPTLNFTRYQTIEGEELEITVIADSQDDPDVMVSETVLIEGDVEEVEDESLLASIPWIWIGVAVGLIVGVFIAIRVIYTVIYS